MDEFSLFLFDYPEKIMCIKKPSKFNVNHFYKASTIFLFRNGVLDDIIKDRYLTSFKKDDTVNIIFDYYEENYSCGYFQGTDIISTGKYKNSLTVMQSMIEFYDELYLYRKSRENV